MNWFRNLFKPKGKYYSDELMADLRVIWMTNGFDMGYTAALNDMKKKFSDASKVEKDTK